jgi:hypothetical protein
MKPVQLPDYVADELLALRSHPSNKKGVVEQSLKRTYHLIADALEGLESAQWQINEDLKLRSAVLNEFYGLERLEHGYCVYGSERGIPLMLAVFADDHLAAKYFVWLVSKGQRTIDWTKFLEMEP